MQADQRDAANDLDMSAVSREFSAETLGELLRALRARATDHPESPALIASWPDVSADRMPAACAELQRRGHPVRELSIAVPRAKARRGWALSAMSGLLTLPAVPSAGELKLLVREVAEPAVLPLARAVLTRFAERESASENVRSAVALAVTEACANVVMHAYAGEEAPGYLEVRACRTGGVLVVEVRDDGRGMVPRVDSPGLGLGLPLIAQMADAFEIRARRERGGLVLRMQFNLSGAPESNQ